MATLLFEDFGGIAPGISSHKRPVGTAKLADNIDFTYGDLRGLPANADPDPALPPLFGNEHKNIYQYRYFTANSEDAKQWLYVDPDDNERVFFVPGPVPEDRFQRLYFSGDGSLSLMSSVI